MLVRVLPSGQKRLPSGALGVSAGGSVANEQGDGRSTEALEEFFEAWIDLPAEHGLLPGQRVIVRFTLTPRPLLVQALRSVRQVLQEKYRI